MADFSTIGVCGAGIMGHGIAQTVAMAGIPVVLMTTTPDGLSRARTRIADSLRSLEAKEKITPEASQDVIRRIRFTTSLDHVTAQCDFIIESVPEVFEVKQRLLADLDARAPSGVVMATNTSQFSITSLAACTKRPSLVVGMHWFAPAVLTRLVEVVRGLETSEDTLDRTVSLAELVGKETIVCQKDSPGFVTTRLIAALTNEAQRLVEEGLASAEDVDRACRLAFGHRMGPFQTADLTGLDTQLRVREALHQAHGERFRPTNLLRTLVAAGHLGQKTGRGFFRYEKKTNT